MSKGHPVIQGRVPPELLAAVQEYLRKRQLHTVCEPWTLSDFVRQATAEKLAKLSRSAKQRKPRRKAL